MQVLLFTDIASTDGYGKYAGTYKIATEIRSHGYTCQVVDNFSYYTYEQLISIVDKFCNANTIMVGFSCTLNEKYIDGKLCHFGRLDSEFTNLVQHIKGINPRIKVCLGGSRINVNSYWTGIDYTVLNKGDVAVIKLLEHLQYGTELKTIKTDPCTVIDGNDYFYTQEQFADSMIKYEPQDIIFPGESLPVEIARGCIFKCAFCKFDLIGKKIGDWTKSPKCLEAELIRNYELFGTTHYLFTDELINESLDKMKMIHSLFRQLPFKITYSSYARLDLIWKFPEMREMLLESGAISLNFGIETMNDAVGRKIGKGLGSARTKETLLHCRELWHKRIITTSNFIVGLPGETTESVTDTFNWLVNEEHGLDIFGFMPLYLRAEDGRPTNTIERQPEKFGIKLVSNNSWETDTMTFAEASKLAHSFNTHPKTRTHCKLSSVLWVGRILNLGYTIEELYDIVFENNYDEKMNLKQEIQQRSLQKKANYYQQLMRLQ